MAKRPAFVARGEKGNLFKKDSFEFQWFPGFAVSQKQKSINEMHKSIKEKYPELKVLEISSKSPDNLGVSLSAFNLIIETKSNMKFSVETAFQASKVFEKDGPFTDLYYKTSKEAKKDSRLKNSGDLVNFKYFNRVFPLTPKTLFYNWLYVNTLVQNESLSSEVLEYDIFTDIEFNPNKSINCQAEAVAVYVSLVNNNLLEKALESVENFKEIVYGEEEKEKKDVPTKYEQISLL